MGRELAFKYLGTDDFKDRLDHTEGVAEFAYRVAHRVKSNNPELVDFDPEFVGFLGYAHDLGYSVETKKHEVHTIEILVREGISEDVARRAMHGQLVEQFGEQEGNVDQYMPIGLDGMVLTYADMSVRKGDPVPVRERAAEIVSRVQGFKISDDVKQDIIDNLDKALPRFERYERNILALAGVNTVGEF